MTQKSFLLLFLGFPGSGKSYFARNLAEKTNTVRLNGDSMRIALYGSVEEIEKQANKKRINRQTFGAIDYAVEQILRTGHSVIYDAHHNKRSIRVGLEKLANEHDAITIVVWVKTPYELALRRGQERRAAPDQRRLSEEKMKQTMERHTDNFDEPVASELVITVDGTMPFEQQFESYDRQLAVLLK